MEYIVIDGHPVAVPREVVSEGRDAIASWIAARATGESPATLSAAESLPPTPAEGEE